MTPDRWRRLEDLFHAARDRVPEERASFLADACPDDEHLRRDVESLLAQQDGTLLREGIAVVAADLVASSPRQNRQGRTLGAYVLGPLLGTGAMGDVHRAHDARLGRDVAVKILPESLAQHPDRLARFEREARILAALNHPHIAAIYGLEESDGLRGLVLELVEGLTLQEKLESGPLPLDETLAIARQIADALEAAHQKGIVHRDLKPANIKITPGGVVKVLDFGIAKRDASDSSGPAALPILETRDGVVLGTVAYMSPEQARGLPVDKRTDIWAFGCLLFEMLTGGRPFPGGSAADVLGAITGSTPDWTQLPSGTPPRIRDVLRRCLSKDPARRLHDIADARLEIDDAINGESAVGERPEDPALARTGQPNPHRARLLLPWLIAGALAVVAATLWLARPQPASARQPLTHLAMELPAAVSVFAIGRGSSIAVSPDGQRVVFVGLSGGRRQLYTTADGSNAVPLDGTENASSPFFSPDGRWIAFLNGAPVGSLMKVPVEGGPPTVIVDHMGDGFRAFSVAAATWAHDDTIVFAAQNSKARGLWQVPSSGGSPTRLTTPAGGELHTWPHVLSGRALLYTVWRNSGFTGAQVVIQPLAGGGPHVLIEGGSYGRFVQLDDARMWLVYARLDGLHAAPLDAERLQLSGSSVPVLAGVLTNMSGGAHFAASERGLLAYVPGENLERNKTALWVTRDGTASEIRTIEGLGFEYQLSPDGRRLVRPRAGDAYRDIFIDDLEREGTPERLTYGANHGAPIWTPDGERVIYARGEPRNLYWRAADGSGPEERLTTSPNPQGTGSVSRDWILAYSETHADRGDDIWLMSLREPRQPRLLVATEAGEFNPVFSPDGQWLAYQSNAGSMEVHLTSIAEGRRQIPVSSGGGHGPLWSPSGRELFYRNTLPERGGNMMAVAIDTTGAEPGIGTPRVLFRSPFQGRGDIAPDGRFLLLKRTPEAAPTRVIRVVLDWFEELLAKAPQR